MNEEEQNALATAPGPLLLTLLGLVVVCLTFGLGSTLEIETVRATLKHKLPPCIGLICQYGIMPAVAYGLSRVFQFSSAKSMGLLLCGIVPGGSTSNLFTYYVGGNVGLSIFLTISSVLLAIGMVPFLLWAYSKPILNIEDDNGDDNILDSGNIPYGSLVLSLALVFFPTLGGIYLRSKSQRWAKRAEKTGSIVGAIFVLIALITGIIDNLELFQSGSSTWIASASLSVIGFTFTFLVSFLFGRLDNKTSLTIALEVGIQNTILAITMTFVLFADAETSVLNEALVFPLMCSLWDIVNSILITIIVFFVKKKKQQPEEEKEKEENPDVEISEMNLTDSNAAKSSSSFRKEQQVDSVNMNNQGMLDEEHGKPPN